MKKSIALLLSIALTQTLSAQNENDPSVKSWLDRKIGPQNETETSNQPWFDIQIAQQVGLTPWSNFRYVNDGLPQATFTELRGVLNIMGKYFGVFADMSLALMPGPKMKTLDLNRVPGPRIGTLYYLQETLSEEDKSGVSASFKMTFGVAGKIPTRYENLTVMPYFGVGFLTMPDRKYEVVLKEDGSNLYYKTMYIWKYNDGNEKSYDNTSNPTLGYWCGRLNFKYKLSKKSEILLGIEYMWFFSTVDFYAKYTNVFNENNERSFTREGNKMKMLGLSVGIPL